jgi:transposase
LQLGPGTIAEVSLKEEIGDKALEGIGDRGISTEVKWAEGKKVKSLGLDEIALKKGQRDFVVRGTGRLAPGAVRVLAVLPDRKKQTVRQFLEAMPKRVQPAIRTVCTDRYEGFIPAVEEV